MYSISINLYLCCLELHFSIKPEIGIASFLSCLGVTTKDKKNVTHVLNSCLIALQNINVKIKIPFQYFCLLIVKVRTVLNFGSKTDTCNAMAQKIHKRIN